MAAEDFSRYFEEPNKAYFLFHGGQNDEADGNLKC